MTATSANTDSEASLLQTIGSRVARELYGTRAKTSIIGAVSTNYFSFTFPVEIVTDSGTKDVYVKIPKADLRGRTPSILPISSNDRLMAQEEENSLRMLAKCWHTDDLGVRWILLRAVIPEYNAIITDHATGEKAFQAFRRLDLRGRLGSAEDRCRLRSAMGRFGGALGRFHNQSACSKRFQLAEMMPKIEHYCRDLAEKTNNPLPNRTIAALAKLSSWECNAVETNTLKGIDIRNMLIDKQDELVLLDPGKTKVTFREADVARFLMTYRILYWGSLQLLLLRRPDPEAEKAFLRAYYGADETPLLLCLYFIKEQLKHWHTALDSLRRLPWPGLVKTWVAHVYVDPLYSRQLALELESLPA